MQSRQNGINIELVFDFIKNIGLPELIIIGVILLILFGGRKVKELSRGLGESTKELKNVKKEFESAKSDKGGGSENV